MNGTAKKNSAYTTPRSDNRTLMQKFAAAPHVFWSALFIIIPLVFVAYYAFTNKDFQFTTENIAVFFTPRYLTVFWRSVKLALIATGICLLIGYPMAYFMSKTSPKKQKILLMLIMLPMWMNFLIRTYAWMVILQNTGIVNSFLAVVGLPGVRIIGTETAVVIGMATAWKMPLYSTPAV